MDHPPESLTFRPAPSQWGALLHHNTSPDATQIRRELQLPTDRAIIMSGHHPGFWHPGVLSKYLAADAAAATFNAQASWLFVDQDRADTVELRYPARVNGNLITRAATIRERSFATTNDVHELVQPGVEQIRTTFSRHSSAPTLSHQLASTLSDLIAPYLSLPHSTLFATELSRTTLFQSLLAKMAKDPERCITTYNASAARHPTSGIRSLTANHVQDRWELPLWHLPPGKPRRHVYAEDLATVPPTELAPKALLMTGLMRLAACDLFIHGLGAAASTTDDPAHEGYDVITEEWFNAWLGATLSPMVLVSATRYLPLSSAPPPTAGEVAQARWRAHHARHNPALLHNATAAAAKQRLLDQLSLLPRHSGARSDAFRNLHSILDQTRRAHADALATLDREAESTAQRLTERALLFDRTWPFPLYPGATLTSLRNEVRAAFRS